MQPMEAFPHRTGLLVTAYPLLAFAVALAARLSFIAGKSIWVDEGYALGLATESVVRLVTLGGAGTPHPPLAFLMAKLSMALFGHTEAGARALFALAGALAVIPLFRFCARRAGGAGALVCSLLWALCPMAVSLGQEAWVYGPLALWAFLALDTADLAWRGSRKAFAGFVLTCAAGFATQHLFLLPALSALGLYFTIDKEGRAPLRWLVLAAAVVALLFIPLAMLFADQFSLRSARMTNAGIWAQTPRRLLLRAPGVFTQMLAGGVFPELGRGLLARPKMIAAMALFSVMQAGVIGLFLFDRKFPRSFRLWMILSFLVPFLVFLVDDPGVRQFAPSWAAFGMATACASSRRLFTGLLPLAASALLLIPYYSIDSFPYHRSNWELAVSEVREMSRPGDIAIVTGSKSAGQAWDFYAQGGLPRIVPEGGNPYLREDMAPGHSDPAAILDSLLSFHERVWLIRDYWGGPPIEDFVRSGRILFRMNCGETIEVLLVGAVRS
jgi:4-amino-4-deoxy-L-arabinose transferase-like glycosyltransferase